MIESKIDYKDCLYCDGYKYSCPCYTPLLNETCGYFATIDSDFDKIATGRRPLTFESLTKLLGKE